MFNVMDAGRTEGTLTVAPGTLSFEPKKANARKNLTIQCSEIRRVEQGQSAYASPHVNLYLTAGGGAGDDARAAAITVKEGERGTSVRRTSPPRTVSSVQVQVTFYTSSGGTGLLIKTPIVDVTSNVISAIIDACKMTRLNK